MTSNQTINSAEELITLMEREWDLEYLYDERIHPLVEQIHEICEEHGLPFITSFLIGRRCGPHGDDSYHQAGARYFKITDVPTQFCNAVDAVRASDDDKSAVSEHAKAKMLYNLAKAANGGWPEPEPPIPEPPEWVSEILDEERYRDQLEADAAIEEERRKGNL